MLSYPIRDSTHFVTLIKPPASERLGSRFLRDWIKFNSAKFQSSSVPQLQMATSAFIDACLFPISFSVTEYTLYTSRRVLDRLAQHQQPGGPAPTTFEGLDEQLAPASFHQVRNLLLLHPLLIPLER
jgi:hypothetical protein